MQANAHVTYNGRLYDWRWIQTKRWTYGWDLLRTVTHIDLLYTAKSQLKGGASLKVISGSDGTLRADNGGRVLAKTPVSGPEWVDAVSGDEKALSYVERHCKLDVLVLEHEYERMQANVYQHPRFKVDVRRCKFCDGELIKRGLARTATLHPPHIFPFK